ncbi:MAG: hypothetical protein R3F65_14625 [bacterium]
MRRALLTLTLFALAGCGGDGGGDDSPDCDGRGTLHDDHCHCDPGFALDPADDLRCVAVEADAGVDAAPEPESDAATEPEPDAATEPAPDAATAPDAAAAPDAATEPEAIDFDPETVRASTLLDDGDRVWLVEAADGEHVLRLENYVAFGGPAAPARVAIGEVEADYAACGLCLVLQSECVAHDDHFHCGPSFMPVPGVGEVELTAVGAAEGEAFAARLSGIELREVTIDPRDYTTTVVPGGRRLRLAEWSFEATLAAAPMNEECGGHGHLHGDHCHCDPGYMVDPEDPANCVPDAWPTPRAG